MSVGQLFRNIYSQWFLQFVRMVIAFVVTVVVARILGPTGYGVVTSIFVFASMFSFILDPGFTPSVIRYISVYSGSNKDFIPILSGYYTYKIIIGSLISAVFYFLSPYLANLVNASGYSFAFQVYSFCILFNAIASVFTCYLNGINRIDLSVLYYSAGFIVNEIASLILVSLGFGVNGYILGYLLSPITILIICLFRYRDIFIKLNMVNFRSRFSGLKMILPLSSSVLISQFTGFIYNWLDKILVLSALGTYGLGIYSIALRFAGVFENVRNSVSSALIPYYGMVFGAEDLAALRGRVFKSSRLISIFFTPSLMFISSLTIVLVPLIYGSAFRSAWSVASAHLIYLGLTSFGIAYGGIPLILEARKEIIINSIIIAFSSIMLEVSLMYMGLDSLGVVIGRDLAMFLGFVYMYVVLYKVNGLKFDLKNHLMFMLMGLIMTVVTVVFLVEFLDLWFMTLVLGLIMYVILIRAFKLLNKGDIALLRQVLNNKFPKVLDIIESLLTR